MKKDIEESLLMTLPGTRDLLPDEVLRWQRVEDTARRIFARYGFMEIRTPLIEPTDLFARGIGGDTDIVGKEMYTFADQSGRSITLRPEATASVVRSYVQHNLGRGSGVTKLYYIGAMFRHEKKQRGRWRQFFQIGAEVLGSDHPAIEVEMIEMTLLFLESLGVQGRLLVNSVGCRSCRPDYLVILKESLRRESAGLCEDCLRRMETNSLRVLDCKVESCQESIDRLPKITDHLCDVCSGHFRRFQEHLHGAGIPFELVPRLVRGLDYYVRTAFEIVSGDLGAQNALLGGGRYDGLSEVLGGPPVQGVGFALGLDRLIMLLPEPSDAEIARAPDVFIAHMGEPAFQKALSTARSLRRAGFECHVEFEAGSLKSQMRLANKLRARHVLIIGEEELRKDLFTLRNMADSTQKEIPISEITLHVRPQDGSAAETGPSDTRP